MSVLFFINLAVSVYLYYVISELKKEKKIDTKLEENRKNNQTLWGRLYGK